MVLTFSLSGMIQFTISNGCVFFLVSIFKWTNFVSLFVGSRNPYRGWELRSHFDEGSLLAQVSFTEALGTGGIGDWGLGSLAITTGYRIFFLVHNMKHGGFHMSARSYMGFFLHESNTVLPCCSVLISLKLWTCVLLF